VKVEGDVGTIGISDHAQARAPHAPRRAVAPPGAPGAPRVRASRGIEACFGALGPWLRARHKPCAEAPRARDRRRALTPLRHQAELGDVVYVELPAKGSAVKAGSTFGVVESVKARQCTRRARARLLAAP
jgi:hypothetical protein